VFERLNGGLEIEGAYLLTGRLSVTEDRAASLIVENARPLEKTGEQAQGQAPAALDDPTLAKQAPVKLYLKIQRSQLAACEQVLSRLPGDIPVYVKLHEEEGTFLAPRSWWTGDELDARADLLTILNSEQIKVVRNT
jgi:hypothetical protein